jgi:phytoene desaturase (3,4-didehydrolycopene-forming)
VRVTNTVSTTLTQFIQRFDQGPSLLLLPELFHETFSDFDTTLEREGVKLVKCVPNYEVYFDDGEQITMSSDLTVMKDQIERYEGQQGFERYLGFLQEAHRHYEVSAEHVLHKNFSSLPALLRPGFLRYLITLHPFESIVSLILTQREPPS